MTQRLTTEQHQAAVDQIERELRESIENVIVGAVERGVLVVGALEQMEKSAQRWNALPRSERIRVWGEIQGDVEAVRASVQDVTFAAKITDDDDGHPQPTFDVAVKLIRPIEVV